MRIIIRVQRHRFRSIRVRHTTVFVPLDDHGSSADLLSEPNLELVRRGKLWLWLSTVSSVSSQRKEYRGLGSWEDAGVASFG